MNTILLLIAILLPVLLGLAVLGLIFKDRTIPLAEGLGLAWLLGLGLTTLTLFVINILNYSINYAHLFLLIVLVIVSLFSLSRLQAYPFFPVALKMDLNDFLKTTWLYKGLMVLIVLKTGYVFFAALIKPVMDWDAVWRHSLIAKVIFAQKTFLDPFALALIRDNPPFTSFAQSWIFFGLNTWQEMLGKIVIPCFFLALLLLCYANLRKYFSQLKSLTFTFLLSSLPFLVYHASTTYADFPFACFYSIGTLYLFIYLKEPKPYFPNLLISALLLGLSIFTKKHGFYLAGINAFVLGVALLVRPEMSLNLKIRHYLSFLVVVFILAFPWFYYIKVISKGPLMATANSFVNFEVFSEKELPPVVQRYPVAINIFKEKMFLFGNWHLAWALLLLGLTFSWRRSFTSPNIYLLLIIGLNLAYVFVALTYSTPYIFLLQGTILNRMMLYQMPLVVMTAAFFLPTGLFSFFNKSSKKKTTR